MSSWRSTSSVEILKLRAQMLIQARAFFHEREIMEVETPLLGLHTVTDPNIDSLAFTLGETDRFLQTSPEYAMKRLLAFGLSDIYQICKSFRIGESGSLHNPEFTLIEWYRLGFTLDDIINDTILLLHALLVDEIEAERISYDDAFLQHVGFSLDNISERDIQDFAIENGLMDAHLSSYNQCVDFVFSQCVVPRFAATVFTIVTDYPASQAALARLNQSNSSLSERFEIFFQGIELANGYHELADEQEQRQRFQKDNDQRRKLGKATVNSDQRLLDALRHGLPDCSGVAVGFDRVIMIKAGVKSISNVMSFDWNSA